MSDSSAKPSKEWCALAVDEVYGSQKTKWRALSKEQQDAILADMWSFSLAREAALRSPKTAAEAEAAAWGWIARGGPLAEVVARLHVALVELPLSSIPRPLAA